MNTARDVRDFFLANRDTIRRLIIINAAVFLFVNILYLLGFLYNDTEGILQKLVRKFMLTANLERFVTQPWSIITYMFLHEDFFHILWNMIVLYWIGTIYQDFQGPSSTFRVYAGGGILGGLTYMLAYHAFPVFKPLIPESYLLGASGGVVALVVAAATLTPSYRLRVFFAEVPLKWLALFIIATFLFSIPKGNAGGHMAHLGGALYGFLFVRHSQGRLFNGEFFNAFRERVGWFFGRKKRPDERHLYRTRVVHYRSETDEEPHEEVINAILDKINQSGYESLTRAEKELLFKASKQD